MVSITYFSGVHMLLTRIATEIIWSDKASRQVIQEKRTEENAKDKALSESQEQKRRRCSAGCFK